MNSSGTELATILRDDAQAILRRWLAGEPRDTWASFAVISALSINLICTTIKTSPYTTILLVIVCLCGAAYIHFRYLPLVRRNNRAAYDKWAQPLHEKLRGVLTEHGLLVQALNEADPPILRKYKVQCWLDRLLNILDRPQTTCRSKQYGRLHCLAVNYSLICMDLGIQGFPVGDYPAHLARIRQRNWWPFKLCEAIAKSVISELLDIGEKVKPTG